uniref:DNA sliding clamp PCNA n=1 Tax=Blastobotrys adeninivorans TaxID=409370 RepID=A0A060T0G1_BLAAD
MLEAKFDQAGLFKKVVEAIREMVKDCNFDCSDTGIAVQAVDSSHIALVSLMLGSEAFSSFRSDRSMTLGMNVESLNKLLKAGGNEDILTLRAEDKSNSLSIVFEDPKQDKISEFNLKLMDIEQDHLSIPETEYTATITLPSSQFLKITRDLLQISEAIKIEASKDGVRFSAEGDIGDGAVNLKPYNDLENKENNVEVNVNEQVTATFNAKYLSDICRGGNFAPQVTLSLTDVLPMEIEYKLPNGHLKYYLAPQMNDGDADE